MFAILPAPVCSDELPEASKFGTTISSVRLKITV